MFGSFLDMKSTHTRHSLICDDSESLARRSLRVSQQKVASKLLCHCQVEEVAINSQTEKINPYIQECRYVINPRGIIKNRENPLGFLIHMYTLLR